ncbi:hypothetical protein DICA0_A05226 [Diutina catenulata]
MWVWEGGGGWWEVVGGVWEVYERCMGGVLKASGNEPGPSTTVRATTYAFRAPFTTFRATFTTFRAPSTHLSYHLPI